MNFSDSTHLLPVFYDLIDFGISSRRNKVCVQNWMPGQNLFSAAVKLLNVALQEPAEPVPVLSTHQTVLEDPAALVVPQLEQLDFCLKTKRKTALILHFTCKITKFNLTLT